MQKRITKDILIYLPAQALPALTSFITVPIYTHLFSPEEFGTYALAVATTEFLLLGTTTGFGQAAVRFFSAYRLRSDLSSYFAVVLSSVGLITLVTAIVSFGILNLFRHIISSTLLPLLYAAVALFVVSAWFATLMDVLRGQENSRWYSIISIIQAISGISFGLILVLVFDMGIAGLIWGQILGLLLLILPLVLLTTSEVAIHSARFTQFDFRQIWAYALPFTIGNIAFWSLSLADRYIVELFRGSYEVGLYSVANKISWRTIQLLVHLFFLVPAPIISRLWEESGRKATEEALTVFTRIFFLMIIPSVIGLSVLAAPIVKLLADDMYFAGYPAIWMIACASMSLGLTNLSCAGCLVTNRTHIIARNQSLAAIVGLILNLILVPMLGFIGAALSAAIAFSFLAILQAISSAHFLTWRWPLSSLWRVLTASAAMAVTVILLQAVLSSDTTLWQVIGLLMSIMAGALVYGVVLWALGEISPKDLLGFFRSDHNPLATNLTSGKSQN